MANRCKRFFYMFYGNYLIAMYLVIKLVYLANVSAQLVLMNKFLGTDYHMYGFRVGTCLLCNNSSITTVEVLKEFTMN